MKEKTLSLTGIVGIFPAATVGGEDVEVYADENRRAVLDSAHFLLNIPGGEIPPAER